MVLKILMVCGSSRVALPWTLDCRSARKGFGDASASHPDAAAGLLTVIKSPPGE